MSKIANVYLCYFSLMSKKTKPEYIKKNGLKQSFYMPRFSIKSVILRLVN